MFIACIKAERLKLKRSFIWLAFAAVPLIPAIMGVQNYLQNLELLKSGWYSLWTQETLFYANFFYGPLIAVYCAYLWRVENFHHNRNALMSAPVPVRDIMLSKLIMAVAVTAATQLWVGILFVISGKLAGLAGFPPGRILFWLLRGLIGGAVIASVQLFLSMVIRSFALPVALAAIGSISGLMAANSSLGLFWPYSLMLLGMNANKDEDMISGSGLAFGISSLVFIAVFSLMGICLLKYRDVKSQ